MYRIIFFLFFLSACSYSFERDADDYAAAYALVETGSSQLEAGNLEEAQAVFLLSNEIVKNAYALDGLGCVAFMRGEIKIAQDYFIAAYIQDNNYYNSLANLALLYDLNGMQDEAYELYNTAIKGNPYNSRIRNNLAALLYDNRRGDKYLRLQAKAELLKAKNLKADKTVLDNLLRIQNNERKP